MNALIRLKKTTPAFVIAFVLAWFALSPTAQAVVPPPDGGYPNFTTAAGDHALQALTSGAANTAIGTYSLFSVTTGNNNTAVGALSLDLNTGDNNTAIGTAALLFNTTGSSNTPVGTDALSENDTGVARLSSASTSLRTSAPLRTQRHLNTLGNGHPMLFRVPKN
jgi:hypothetical protein